MKKNLGSFDKVIRLVIATVLIILVMAGNVAGPWAVLCIILAAILIITSLINFCPLWAAFGINTSKTVKTQNMNNVKK